MQSLKHQLVGIDDVEKNYSQGQQAVRRQKKSR